MQIAKTKTDWGVAISKTPCAPQQRPARPAAEAPLPDPSLARSPARGRSHSDLAAAASRSPPLLPPARSLLAGACAWRGRPGGSYTKRSPIGCLPPTWLGRLTRTWKTVVAVRAVRHFRNQPPGGRVWGGGCWKSLSVEFETDRFARCAGRRGGFQPFPCLSWPRFYYV